MLNLSAEQDHVLYSWLPNHLNAETVVCFPDACPGRSPLPTGTATLLRRPDWRRFAISDCGCGMRLLRSDLGSSALTQRRWDVIADTLRANKGGLGDLGGGNHFVDAIQPYDEDRLYFLVHTGSRDESSLVDDLVKRPAEFDQEFERIVQWARDNRAKVQEALEAEFGRLRLVLDLPHNTFEVLPDGAVILRKGAVRVQPGELNAIPSHMMGDVALVKATSRVAEALNSMSHGTGRTVPRSEAKRFADGFDFEALRRSIMIPTGVSNNSLRTDLPAAYRNLNDCLALLDGYVEEVSRFAVIGYLGHL